MREYLWPESGDDLFREGGDWWHTAIIQNEVHGEYVIARSFKEAGDRLVAYVSDKKTGQDVLVFPIMFAYRHHLELMIKAVIKEGRRHLGCTGDYKYTHDLMELWSKCRGILEAIFPDEDIEPLDATEHILAQLARVDPKSLSFRYPANQKSQAQIDHLRIPLASVARVVEGAGNFLDGSVNWIVEQRQLSTGEGEEGYF